MSEDEDFQNGNGVDEERKKHKKDKKKKHKKDKDRKKKKEKRKRETSADDDVEMKSPPKAEVKAEPERFEDTEEEKFKDEAHYSSPEVKSEPDSGSDWSDGEKPKKKTKKRTPSKKTPTKKTPAKATGKRQSSGTIKTSPTKRVKKEVVEEPKWKWWEEDPEEKRKREEAGIKWKTLSHRGPLFPPDYEKLPSRVQFKYDGKHMKLSPNSEETMGFYAAMLRTDYVTDEAKSALFSKNFFKDWQNEMTKEEKAVIKDLKKCNFTAVLDYFDEQREKRKARSKEEKEKEKVNNAKLMEEYGFCTWDGHTEKIGNFRLEPPGLFRGRGEHPKMGKLKSRIRANDIIINISKDSTPPPAPGGQRWKEIRHDDKVTWLACWIENVQGQYKYVMLNANSRIKGEKDWAKYEKARKLKQIIHKVRATYEAELQDKLMFHRQRAVAMYFIDKLALRAGNEKDTEEAADTVGCCSLRVEHIKLHDTHIIEGEEKPYVIEFDFLGKDSMRYHNFTAVTKRVFKNVKLFQDGKNGEDDLFDRLDTMKLNKHLNGIMDGLTAKVFRTYNASNTLQQQLDKHTVAGKTIAEFVLTYNQANRAVAILCNHKRTAPKSFDEQMQKADEKIQDKMDKIKEKQKEVKRKKSDGSDVTKERGQLSRLEEQLTKLKCAAQDREENKEIALGTSKLNYLDPRISIGWCKKWDVPIEKVYNKTQRDKFAWAIAMAEADFSF